MRTLNDTGLIRIEYHQWPAVERALVGAGYVLARDKGNHRKTVWDVDYGACVGEHFPEERCYYLDERVRDHLPRPVGRPFLPDPWTDLGGEG